MPFRVNSLSQKKFLARLPVPVPRNFLPRSGGGGRRGPGGFTGPHPTLSPRFHPRSHLSPLTPPDGWTRTRFVAFVRCGPRRGRLASANQRNFPILIFFVSQVPPLECRSSDLSVTLHIGAERVPENKNTKHVVPSYAPTIVFFTNTISRCQRKSRPGRPVAVHGAPLNLLRVFCPV